VLLRGWAGDVSLSTRRSIRVGVSVTLKVLTRPARSLRAFAPVRQRALVGTSRRLARGCARWPVPRPRGRGPRLRSRVLTHSRTVPRFFTRFPMAFSAVSCATCSASTHCVPFGPDPFPATPTVSSFRGGMERRFDRVTEACSIGYKSGTSGPGGRFLAGLARAPTGAAVPGKAAPGPQGVGDPRPGRAVGPPWGHRRATSELGTGSPGGRIGCCSDG